LSDSEELDFSSASAEALGSTAFGALGAAVKASRLVVAVPAGVVSIVAGTLDVSEEAASVAMLASAGIGADVRDGRLAASAGEGAGAGAGSVVGVVVDSEVSSRDEAGGPSVSSLAKAT